MGRNFEAAGDRVSTVDAAFQCPADSDITVGTWVREVSGGNVFSYLLKTEGNAEIILLSFASNTAVRAIAYCDTGTSIADSTVSIYGGAWHFVCAEWDATSDTVSLYVDDMDTAEDTDSNAGEIVQLGASSQRAIGDHESGVVTSDFEQAEFSYFHRTLSAGERNTLMRRGASFVSGCECYYRLGQGSTEPDLSGGGWDGTVQSSAPLADHPPVGLMPGLDGWAGAYTAPGNAMPMAIHHYKMAGGL